MSKTKLLILGSTGSIGSQTLEVVRAFSDQFVIVGLSVFSNTEKLLKQAKEFDVKNLHIFSKRAYGNMPLQANIFSDKKGLTEIVKKTDFDILVNAVSGEIGIEPTKEALKKGKIVALANKETMVAAGLEIMKLARKNKAEIRPIDSEHSAIWQCLKMPLLPGHAEPVEAWREQYSSNLRQIQDYKKQISKIYLTCSGGPFRDKEKWPLEKFENIKKEDALAHPNWEMGAKISIDSATLMNKALELIEAVRLFEIDPNRIEVVIHPESIIHSAVEYLDGSIIAQMGTPDMRTAIALAISAPERLKLPFKRLNLFEQNLSFQKVDHERFPSINFARKALEKGEKACNAMNLANEKAVAAFLSGQIRFSDIFEMVKKSI